MLLDLVLAQWRLGARKRMARRHGEQPLHFAQRRPLQVRHGLRFVGGAHDQVRSALAQRLPRAAQHLVREPQPHARVQLVECLDERRHELEFQDFVADDAQPVLPTAGDLPHPLRQPADVLGQPPGFVGQQLPRGRELHPVAPAVE